MLRACAVLGASVLFCDCVCVCFYCLPFLVRLCLRPRTLVEDDKGNLVEGVVGSG